MGIVSDDDFDKELTNSRAKQSEIKAEIVNLPPKGRGEGNVEVPDSLRKVIGETSVTEGRQEALALAKNFGISESAVSAYAQGAKSTSTYDDRPNEKVINDAKQKVQTEARLRLMDAIKHLTNEKLGITKARDLAGIAKDMAVVIRQMEPDIPSARNVNNGPTFVFYSPQQRKEESYDIVFTKE